MKNASSTRRSEGSRLHEEGLYCKPKYRAILFKIIYFIVLFYLILVISAVGISVPSIFCKQIAYGRANLLPSFFFIRRGSWQKVELNRKHLLVASLLRNLDTPSSSLAFENNCCSQAMGSSCSRIAQEL